MSGAVNRYIAVYKCQLCGKLLAYGNPCNVPEEALPELLGKVVGNQAFAGNPYLHQVSMFVPHRCGNGDGGMAVFAGFKKQN